MLESRRNSVEDTAPVAERNTIADVLRRRGSLRIAPEHSPSQNCEVSIASADIPSRSKTNSPKPTPTGMKRWLSEAVILDNKDEYFSFNDASDDDLFIRIAGAPHERLPSQNKFTVIDEAIKQIMK
jgi:hypothetical protein